MMELEIVDTVERERERESYTLEKEKSSFIKSG